MINRTTVPVGDDLMETVTMSDNAQREVVAIGSPDADGLLQLADVINSEPAGTEMGLVVRDARPRRIKAAFEAMTAPLISETLDVSSVSPSMHTIAIAPQNTTSYSYELEGAIDGNFFSLSGRRDIQGAVPDMVSVDGRPVDEVRVNLIDIQGAEATVTPTYLGVA
jgi:hypothetical protein